MVNPQVHILSEDSACIAYVRLTQYLDKWVINYLQRSLKFKLTTFFIVGNNKLTPISQKKREYGVKTVENGAVFIYIAVTWEILVQWHRSMENKFDAMIYIFSNNVIWSW